MKKALIVTNSPALPPDDAVRSYVFNGNQGLNCCLLIILIERLCIMITEITESMAGTELETIVSDSINESINEDYDLHAYMSDLRQGGCQSGFVSELIYYIDTIRFYETHKQDINDLLDDALVNTGSGSPIALFSDKWDTSDPLALSETNQNLLAWFGFEEAASLIYGRAENN